MKIQIFDTTLRDGTQGEGVSLSCDDKLRIASRLDEFGVDYIEGGWPGSNPKDMEFFERAAHELTLRRARLTAFGSTCKRNTEPAADPQIQLLLAANTPVISLFGKSWDLHVRDVLQTTVAENLRMIRESVAYLKGHGKEIIYDAEHFFDGYKQNRDYALATLRAAVRGGAACIVLCDTNGGSLAWEIGEIVSNVRRELLTPGAPLADGRNGSGAQDAGMVQGTTGVTLGIHAHNDGDTAVANSLEAIRSGCTHVQGTINGYGERCGNANLVSELSGKDNITVKADEFGVEGLSREKERAVLQQIKELENIGFAFESAEASVDLMLRRSGERYRPRFALIDYTSAVANRAGRGLSSEATVKVEVGEQVYHEVAEGNGPVNALMLALRKAIQHYYPQLDRLRLVDYKVRILNSEHGTGASVRVLITSSDGERNWTTVGARTNIIEASWTAIYNAVEYFLLTSVPPAGAEAAAGNRAAELSRAT